MIIKIKNKLINENSPCFIIAEAGVNHNGNIQLAKKLVNVAKNSGADAVKFQTFKSEDLVGEKTEMAEYQKRNIGRGDTQLGMLKKLELSHRDFTELKKYCDKKEIMFLSTPHTEDAIDFLEPLVPAYKLASGDITNFPFLKKIARKKKPIILSTGMATLEEVREAVKTIKKAGNNKIILLHCATNYPCPSKEVNLRAMLTLKKEFKLPVGFSDHTSGILAPVMAFALGAKVLEKHFTLDKDLPGPDHKASLEPKELKEMVKTVREAEIILGSGVKKPTDGEETIKKIVRKSIVAKNYILRGAVITEDMLIIKRPGTGIEPKYLNKIVGRKAKKDIRKDSLIQFKDLI